MSRIGRMPVVIPAGVTVDVKEGNHVTVKGPKGELTRDLAPEMTIEVKDGEVIVTRPNDLKRIKSLHGLTRSLIHNLKLTVSATVRRNRAKRLSFRSAIRTRSKWKIRKVSKRLLKAIRSQSAVSARKRSASTRPISASSVRRNPIRARASSTAMRSSAVKSARPVNNKGACVI